MFNGMEDETVDKDLTAALDVLRSELHKAAEAGAICPVCDQRAQVYRRKINSGMILALATMYKRAGLNWFHKPTVLRGVGAAARDESFLRFWGLIEERDSKSPDGRSGWWRVTPKGSSFISGMLTVPKYVHTYNGVFIRFSGPHVDAEDAGGEAFSLRELLEGSDRDDLGDDITSDI